MTNSSPPQIIARFYPQAWIRNYAVDVDAEGDVTFDVTPEVLKLGREQALALEDNSDASDVLHDAAGAPQWIKDWDGPYYIEVQDSIASYFEATS